MLDLRNRDGYADKATDHAFGDEINPSLLVLKYLVYLDLSMNNFGGLLYLDPSNNVVEPIENDLHWLATLSSLKYLNLEGVNLAKTTSYWLPTVNMLPSFVELHLPSCRLPMLPLTLPSINFTSLLVLDLSDNKFTSTIPPWLFNLTELEMLDLTDNNLTGKLPDSLGYLKSLRYLDLSYNSFQGSIPKSIGNLTSLEEFDLAWNQMSGIIPESLGKLSSLVSLDIYGNQHMGRCHYRSSFRETWRPEKSIDCVYTQNEHPMRTRHVEEIVPGQRCLRHPTSRSFH
ncbi:leucine-rich repeat receptor-like protein kinase PEPR1 [Prunus avium]|uniref:Leucine-rich repeat receptor-like protein kinase PEPR1 n=1 Tax=Prunus avium TaxID=42229 RepID=A0A6P5SZ42_PRUAV|nr:leucine-rich repeat receptor-like protein kinase PEPR1 [Prunus avium]